MFNNSVLPFLQIDSFIGSFPILPCLRCHAQALRLPSLEAYAVDLIIERYGFSDDLLDSLARPYVTPEIQAFLILRNRELFSVIGPQLMGNIGFNSQLSGFTLLQACNQLVSDSFHSSIMSSAPPSHRAVSPQELDRVAPHLEAMGLPLLILLGWIPLVFLFIHQ